jgi:hypothetical protein
VQPDSRHQAISRVLSSALSEAMRNSTRFGGEPRVITTTITDLVVGIVLEPDILTHLVNDRDLTVDIQALRRSRNPEKYARQNTLAEAMSADEPAEIALLKVGGLTETKIASELQSVVDATFAWIEAIEDPLQFTRWTSKSLGVLGAASQPHDVFRPFPMSDQTGLDDESLKDAMANGLTEEQARQMFDSMMNLQPTAQVRTRIGQRNFRLAALRDLFERASMTAPSEVAVALDTLGITALDLHATFDSLAMSWGMNDDA